MGVVNVRISIDYYIFPGSCDHRTGKNTKISAV